MLFQHVSTMRRALALAAGLSLTSGLAWADEAQRSRDEARAAMPAGIRPTDSSSGVGIGAIPSSLTNANAITSQAPNATASSGRVFPQNRGGDRSAFRRPAEDAGMRATMPIDARGNVIAAPVQQTQVGAAPAMDRARGAAQNGGQPNQAAGGAMPGAGTNRAGGDGGAEVYPFAAPPGAAGRSDDGAVRGGRDSGAERGADDRNGASGGRDATQGGDAGGELMNEAQENRDAPGVTEDRLQPPPVGVNPDRVPMSGRTGRGAPGAAGTAEPGRTPPVTPPGPMSPPRPPVPPQRDVPPIEMPRPIEGPTAPPGDQRPGAIRGQNDAPANDEDRDPGAGADNGGSPPLGTNAGSEGTAPWSTTTDPGAVTPGDEGESNVANRPDSRTNMAPDNGSNRSNNNGGSADGAGNRGADRNGNDNGNGNQGNQPTGVTGPTPLEDQGSSQGQGSSGQGTGSNSGGDAGGGSGGSSGGGSSSGR